MGKSVTFKRPRPSSTTKSAQQNKKKKIQPVWDGTSEEIRARIIDNKNWPKARLHLTVLRIVRKNLPHDLLECLELHMSLRSGDEKRVKDILNERRVESKMFILHLVHYMGLEYQRKASGLSVFRPVFLAYKSEDLVELFARAIKSYPELACDFWLALISVRTDSTTFASLRLMECLKNGLHPSHGMYKFGNSVLKNGFKGLMPDQIFLICDVVLRTSVKEFNKTVLGDDLEARKKCELRASKFMVATYPFYFGVLHRLGLPVLPPQTNAQTFIMDILHRLPKIVNPPIVRILAYCLAVLKLRMPNLTENNILVPFTKSFLSRVDDTGEIEHDKTIFAWGPVMEQLALLVNTYDFTSRDFKYAMDLAGLEDMQRLIAMTFFYSSRAKSCFKFCLHTQETGKSEDPVIQAVHLANLYAHRRDMDCLPYIFTLWKIAVKNNWNSVSPAIASIKEGNFKEPLAFLKLDCLGHWLSLLMSMILRDLNEKSDLEDSGLIVLSQLEYGRFGSELMSKACRRIIEKSSFSSPDILKYIDSKPVCEALIALLSQESCTIDFGVENPLDAVLAKLPATKKRLKSLENITQFFMDNELEFIQLTVKDVPQPKIIPTF